MIQAGEAQPERDTDLVLAGVHLRLGSLSLARAELEALAGGDGLDAAALVDLAEVRWRTGDLTGAGEAAEAALEDGTGPLLALIVAAEASAARGRPTEARRLAELALAAAGGSIDRWFAGMPRSSVWPADGHDPSPAPTTLFQSSPGDARREATAARAAALAAAVRRDRAAPEFAGGAAANATLALWDVDDRPDSASAESLLPLAEADLERGRVALTEEDVGEAAIRLGLALRLAPDLAPVILDLLDGQPARELALVRGDAHRLVGQEIEAQRAFGEAGRSGPLPTPEGDRP